MNAASRHPGMSDAPLISESEVLQFLKGIEDGSVSLQPDADPQDVYAGNVTYAASNGWQIRIFNDCNEWDYIDRIETPDGRNVGFDALDEMPSVRDYDPGDEVAWSRYGIPGYMKFRCRFCGDVLTPSPTDTLPHLCIVCRNRQDRCLPN
jgi:hypothetical protein